MAMALCEIGRQPGKWRTFIILVGLGAVLAAVFTEIWWLLLISLLALGDLFLLYIATGFSKILDLDEGALRELQDLYEG